MLTRLVLENFKPFRTAQDIPLAGVTLIYGPNSSGKSSIIQSLMLLSQTASEKGNEFAGLVTGGPLFNFSLYKSVVHRGDLEKNMNFLIERDSSHIRRIELEYATISTLNKQPELSGLERFCVEYAGKFPAQFAGKFEGMCGGDRHYNWLDGSDQNIKNLFLNVAINYLAIGLDREQFHDEYREKVELELRGDFNKFDKEPEGRFDEAGLRSLVPFDEDAVVSYLCDGLLLNDWRGRKLLPLSTEMPLGPNGHYVERYLEEIEDEVCRTLQGVSFLGPLRSPPQRFYSINDYPGGVGKNGQHTADTLYRFHDKVLPSVNRIIDYIGLQYKIELVSIGDQVTGPLARIDLLDLRSGVRVAPTDVGFGLGQLLPIIVEGLTTKNTLICVEQPEIHLHPKQQADLGDFFAGSICGPKKQWLIETHSEMLILRLQRRIREGALKPEDVSVLYVNPLPSGESEVLRLRLDEKGRFIDEWPRGFFEEGYREQLA